MVSKIRFAKARRCLKKAMELNAQCEADLAGDVDRSIGMTTPERFDRIEAQLARVIRVLTKQTRQLECLTETLREDLHFFLDDPVGNNFALSGAA